MGSTSIQIHGQVGSIGSKVKKVANFYPKIIFLHFLSKITHGVTSIFGVKNYVHGVKIKKKWKSQKFHPTNAIFSPQMQFLPTNAIFTQKV